MKKRKWGALALSLAMAGAAIVPVSISAVRAAGDAPSAMSEATQIPQNVGELETAYANIVKKNYEAEVAEDKTSEKDGDAATGVVRGADTYGTLDNADTNNWKKKDGRNYWNVHDINPDSDNVTLSYTYESTKAGGTLAEGAIGSYGFGFRFTLLDEAGNEKHVTLLRHQR